MKNKTVTILLITIFLISACIHLVRTPKIGIPRYSASFSEDPVMYCDLIWMSGLENHACRVIIFFPDGSLLASGAILTIYEDDGVTLKESYFSSYEQLYRKDNRLGWGRYQIVNDTVYYEFAPYLNMGGAPHFPKISKNAVEIGQDSLFVFPAFHHRRVPSIFKANDTLTYVRVDYPDIYNIDPSKAWINNK